MIAHAAFILALPSFEHLELSLCNFDNRGIFSFCSKKSYEETVILYASLTKDLPIDSSVPLPRCYGSYCIP